MASKEALKQKQSKVAELSKLIDLHSTKKVPLNVAQEIENEQYRIEFRLIQLEELGLDAKIEGMQKVLRILQAVK